MNSHASYFGKSTGSNKRSVPMKKQGKTPKLSWSNVCLAPFFRKKCMLCLKEETFIAMFDPNKLINCRSELSSKFIHKHVYELSNVHKPRPNPMPKKPKSRTRPRQFSSYIICPSRKRVPANTFLKSQFLSWEFHANNVVIFLEFLTICCS